MFETRGDKTEDLRFEETEYILQKYVGLLELNIGYLEKIGKITFRRRSSSHVLREDSNGKPRRQIEKHFSFGIYEERGFAIDIRRPVFYDENSRLDPRIKIYFYIDGGEMPEDFRDIFGPARNHTPSPIGYRIAKNRIESLLQTNEP